MPARTRVIMLMHRRELHRPSNTARLAAHCLPDSELIVFGDRDRPGRLPDLARFARPVVLFPAPDAVPLARWPGPPPDCLIVPDGTWAQAAHMLRRIDGLQALPCVSLPEAAAPFRRLRATTHAGTLCTMEAIARALGCLGEMQVSEQLLAILARKVDLTLWMRGELARQDVTGGVPDGAARHYISLRAGIPPNRS